MATRRIEATGAEGCTIGGGRGTTRSPPVAREQMMTSSNAQLSLPLIDPTRCTGCGVCVQLCPTNAVAICAQQALIVRPQACSYCDLCETYCPTAAISRPFTIVFAPES